MKNRCALPAQSRAHRAKWLAGSGTGVSRPLPYGCVIAIRGAMSGKAYLLLPFAAGLLYALSQFGLKRAFDLGVGPWRSAFIANWLSGLVFLPLAFIRPDGPFWEGWGPALAAAGALFAGQLLAFLAIERGDVSVAAPMMGAKVLGVVVLSVLLFRQGFGWDMWLAALLTTIAIALLQWGPSHERGRILRTVFLAGAAALHSRCAT